MLIALHPEFGSGRGLTQSCSSRRELFNAMSYSFKRRREEVDSWLLMVESQTGSLIPGPSFAYNMGCKCPNGSYEAILGIYTSRPFHWHKERINARRFNPSNCLLNFWESRRTPSLPLLGVGVAFSHFAQSGVATRALQAGIAQPPLGTVLGTTHVHLIRSTKARGWVLQPHFGQVWGWSPTLGNVGGLKSFGTPECLELNNKAQNTSHWGVFGVIGKVLKRRYQKRPRIGNSDIYSPSYGQKKGRGSNWQFDSRPLKVENRPLPDVFLKSVTRRWKALDGSYNIDSRLVPIRVWGEELWPFKVPGVQLGHFRDSISGVPIKCAIRM